MRLITEVSLMV